MADMAAGEKMPAFELPDQNGTAWNLDEKLSEGPVMLVVYRGNW